MSNGFWGVWLLLILLFSLILCFYSFRQKIYSRLILALPIVCISYYLLQLFGADYGTRPSDLIIFLFCGICSALIILGIIQVYLWQQTHLSEMSVKYAVDALPLGICCYEEEGKILLKNKTMENLYRKITGKALLNGISFQNLLKKELLGTEFMVQSAGAFDFLRTGEIVVVIFPDRKVYEFQLEELTDPSQKFRKNKCFILTASDITEEYQKTQTLFEKQKTVTELNQRLKEYNQEILSVITAREILNAKVKIHDELGASLLRVKKHLSQNTRQPAEQMKIIDSLRKNVTFLQRELNPIEKDEYKLLLKTAKDLDVKVEITGKLPEDDVLKDIYVTAFHECLTNTLRHAKGNLLQLTFFEDEKQIQGIYTNNGAIPSGKIVEKGGLKSLRNLVEQEKGKMEISIEDRFSLSIIFSK